MTRVVEPSSASIDFECSDSTLPATLGVDLYFAARKKDGNYGMAPAA